MSVVGRVARLYGAVGVASVPVGARGMIIGELSLLALSGAEVAAGTARAARMTVRVVVLVRPEWPVAT